jgi:hypothetical protein
VTWVTLVGVSKVTRFGLDMGVCMGEHMGSDLLQGVRTGGKDESNGTRLMGGGSLVGVCA